MTTQVSFEKNLKIEEGSLAAETARQRFLVNVFSSIAIIFSQAAVNLWMTPFLISRLGIATFGMIPLVNTVASYITVFTRALKSAVGRFLAIDLGESDDVAANTTFNTALFGLVGLILGLAPVVVAGSLFFPAIFRVPPGWERDASWLFAMVASSSFVSVVAGIFALSPFVHSQFFLSNLVSSGDLLARLAIVVILFAAFQAHLWYAGAGILVGAVVSLFGHIILWRRLTPQLHIRLSAFDRSQLRSVIAMGGWLVVNTIGALLLSRVDLLVVNVYFGAAVTGGYGSVAQLAFLMDYLVNAPSTVIRPVLLLKFAQGDFQGLRRIASQAVKLLGLALALPVGLLCGFSRPILSIWLGPSFAYLSPLLMILSVHQSLNLSVRPLLFVQNAYNRVRWPGIVTLLSGIVNLALAALVAEWGRWGFVGVALAGALVWTVKNTLYVPIYTAHIMNLAWWCFLPNLASTLAATLVVGTVAYGFAHVRMPANWLELAISAFIVSVFYAAGLWSIGLSRDDRRLLGELLPQQIGQYLVPNED